MFYAEVQPDFADSSAKIHKKDETAIIHFVHFKETGLFHLPLTSLTFSSITPISYDMRTHQVSYYEFSLPQRASFEPGTVVTAGAMNCQTEIIDLILKKKAHYFITLKANQSVKNERLKEWE